VRAGAANFRRLIRTFHETPDLCKDKSVRHALHRACEGQPRELQQARTVCMPKSFQRNLVLSLKWNWMRNQSMEWSMPWHSLPICRRSSSYRS
jgi:hypothetical protein